MIEQPKILIVYGYHLKETFAIEVGGYLCRDNANAEIQLVKYKGKQDKGLSSHNLLEFVGKFNPVISPIVLHGDDEAGFTAAIVYNAHTKQNKRMAQKPLLNFCFQNSCDNGDVITWGRFSIEEAQLSFIDMELNSEMGLEKAAVFVKNFSQYLIDLQIKGIRL